MATAQETVSCPHLAVFAFSSILQRLMQWIAVIVCLASSMRWGQENRRPLVAEFVFTCGLISPHICSIIKLSKKRMVRQRSSVSSSNSASMIVSSKPAPQCRFAGVCAPGSWAIPQLEYLLCTLPVHAYKTPYGYAVCTCHHVRFKSQRNSKSLI